MKQLLLTLLMLAVLTGCAGEKTIPASRLKQPSGAFSFITPDGWFRTKLAGISYIIVSAESDFGTRPNIFVDWVEQSAEVVAMVSRVQETHKGNHPDYEVSHQSDFTTDSGLSGKKLSASRKNRDGLPLATFHYLLQDAERVICITCTCAEPTRSKYELIFDKALKTLETQNPDK